MFCAVIMPVYNEAARLDQVLQSFASQTNPCDLLILVDDGSTDDSPTILRHWAAQHPWMEVISSEKKSQHAPGQKVVHAFYRGYEYLQKRAQAKDFTVELIGKFDADIVLPTNYFEVLRNAFRNNNKLGLASGLLYIQKNNEWIYEQIAKKQKVRGPIKLYRQDCFDQIGGLKPCLGWDSIDQWLAQYWGWQTQTFAELQVKHLKATAQAYRPEQLSNQGRAFAHMGYGFLLTAMSLIKLALHYKKPELIFSGLGKYWQYRNASKVTPDQMKFIRKSLWSSVRSSILNNR